MKCFIGYEKGKASIDIISIPSMYIAGILFSGQFTTHLKNTLLDVWDVWDDLKNAFLYVWNGYEKGKVP